VVVGVFFVFSARSLAGFDSVVPPSVDGFDDDSDADELAAAARESVR
jgi:hypothetical protein